MHGSTSGSSTSTSPTSRRRSTSCSARQRPGRDRPGGVPERHRRAGPAIAQQVADAKAAIKVQRAKTKKLRRQRAAPRRGDLARAQRRRATCATSSSARERPLDDEAAEARGALAPDARPSRRGRSEIDALQAGERATSPRRSARAQAKRQAGAPTQSTPSSAGLIWPVNGPVTSPFGWRWGRMHEGSTSASATARRSTPRPRGTVIYCGWEAGYGNLVVIDHGGNLATAYGHQSSIAVACGQHVNQGHVIGYVGCTGHCFGPHLHFEVRVNGDAGRPARLPLAPALGVSESRGAFTLVIGMSEWASPHRASVSRRAGASPRGARFLDELERLHEQEDVQRRRSRRRRRWRRSS